MAEKKKPSLHAQSTGYVFEPDFLDYDLDMVHPECPERLYAIQKKMAESGLEKRLVKLSPIPDPFPYIRKIHTEQHVSAIRNIEKIGRIAALAVAGGCAAVKAVAEGTVRNAFCTVRPPGHHARNTGQEEGFCFYNNVAIAARYAQEVFNVRKILIVDWDFHHGNGTEEAFYEDPTVLYFSTHYALAYPGTGHPGKEGKEDGLGYNINVHMACGATDENIIEVFNTVLVPRADAFRPDLIMVSAGFDGRENDMLGCFDITDDGFRALTKIVMDIGRRHCNDRVVSMLEGGYTPPDLAGAVYSHVKTLLEYRPE
jgi:acetoin utilization deacetylase AcuC-like enzyme